MKRDDVRSIYSQELDIRCAGLRVRRLCLNRHLPEKDWVASHRHTFSQFLVYLAGRGTQKIAGNTHAVGPGSVFYIPPRVQHAFIETSGRRPLCLAIDVSLPANFAFETVCANLVQSEVTAIRRGLSALGRWHTGPATVEPREGAAVLQMLDVLLRSVGHLSRSVDRTAAPIVARVRRAIESSQDASVSRIAEAVGYHRDHLNRLLKHTAGVSIGRLRSERRLQRAKSLLQSKQKIADVAWDLGFTDPNYFSRWFRQQSGAAPGEWRRSIYREK